MLKHVLSNDNEEAAMTELLTKAIRAVEALDPAEQDRIADAMLSLVDLGVIDEEIDPEHLQDILEGLAEAERGEFATEEDVEAAFRAFRG